MHNEHLCLIISLWDSPFVVPRKHRHYQIPARPDNGKSILEPGFEESYGVCKVFDIEENLEFGEKQKVPWRETAEKVAPDIVTSEDMTKFGIFVAYDEGGPTAAELGRAKANLLRHLKWLVNDGDKKYSRPETRADVNDLHRKAVIMLGEQREWVYQLVENLVDQSSKCPACGSDFRIPDPAVCAVCGAVLNQERAAKYGLNGFAAAPKQEQPRIAGKFARKEE